MPSVAIMQALTDAEAAIRTLRAIVEANAHEGEAPIPVKDAAWRYGTSQRTMQRIAAGGCGVKVRNRWCVYPSLVLLPKVDP